MAQQDAIVMSAQQGRVDAAARAVEERDRLLSHLTPALAASGHVEARSKPELMAAAMAGAPHMIFDLPMLCQKCTAPLHALSYDAFVNDTRFMLWIEGVCPRCMERRKIVFDPMVGAAAKSKLRAEQDALWDSWRQELAPDPDEDESNCGVKGLSVTRLFGETA